MEVSDTRKSDQRVRLGLECLEARNLQSVLAGDAAPSAPLVEPPPSSTSAYDTSAWGASSEELSKKVKIDFFSIKGETAAIEGEFKKIKGQSAGRNGEFKTIKY